MDWKNVQRTKIAIVIIVLACISFFLFYNLGHDPLWDDEAATALFAKSVWRTGDTYAILDHNLIGHSQGRMLKDLHDRFSPPLHYYLAAPFVGSTGTSAFAARLPFAVCGLLTVVVILYWLYRSSASVSTWILTTAGILGNVSFMLYSRQCRYYAPTILFATILVFLYVFRKNDKRTALVISLVSLLLLTSNYLCYAAVYACLIADYSIWGRKIRPLGYSELAIIFCPQLVFGAFFINAYGLLGKDLWHYAGGSWLTDKLTLLMMNLRDLNGCEFGVGVLILISPLLYFYTKNKWLLRCPFAIFIYIFVVSLLSPQPKGLSPVAFVQYLVPLIPLCIITAVFSIQALTRRLRWFAVPLAVLAFFTNVLHGGPLVGADRKAFFAKPIADVRFRSTVMEFIKELISPPPSAYGATADWINLNVSDKETVVVVPSYATLPLMYSAPKALYGWQLRESSKQFSKLPQIHFAGKVVPQYFIAFGPYINVVKQWLRELEKRGIIFTQVEHLDIYWHDLTRPTLYWHSFREIRDFLPESESIYIFKRLHQEA